MFKQKIIHLILLFSCFLGGCKKSNIPQINCNTPTEDITIARHLILGQWDWIYESYYDRFAQMVIIKNPITEGKTRQYHFHENGLVYIFQNDTFVRKESFEITTLNIVTGSEMDSRRTIVLFKNIQTQQRTDFAPMRICNDTLTLNYDFYSHTRGREKWSRL
jgi:hypothetical protein